LYTALHTAAAITTVAHTTAHTHTATCIKRGQSGINTAAHINMEIP
jgi:hypothetical protein